MSDVKKRIEEIRARHAAITPGPWRWYGSLDTDQIYLATAHSGRMYMLAPVTREEEWVFDHREMESYTLAEARERKWTEEPTVAYDINEFLRGELSQEEGRRDFHGPLSGDLWLTRSIRVTADLQFQNDGRMQSYRDIARFEVLNGRTLEEHVANGGRESDLYRSDIVGLANREAEFIASAPEDIQYLLAELDHAHRQLAKGGSRD